MSNITKYYILLYLPTVLPDPAGVGGGGAGTEIHIYNFRYNIYDNV